MAWIAFRSKFISDLLRIPVAGVRRPGTQGLGVQPGVQEVQEAVDKEGIVRLVPWMELAVAPHNTLVDIDLLLVREQLAGQLAQLLVGVLAEVEAAHRLLEAFSGPNR